MKRLLQLILLCLIATPLAGAAEIRFNHEGIQVDAGSIGKFTIEFPSLLAGDGQKAAHKLQEKNTAENTATLKYDGDGQIDLALAPGGKLVMKLVRIPADVKSIGLDMQIPIAFNQGGKWKTGDSGADFPREKPPKPHLYQGHSTTFQITNYEGRSLGFTLPEFTFVQLSDNREWNWPIFHFKSLTPYNADRKELTVTIEAAASGEKAAPLVDALGQSARETWPDKVKSLDELKADVEAEKAYYATLRPPEPLDPHGGPNPTGFFYVKKAGDRWLLLDPKGDLFFHLGVCAVCPSEDYTVVRGRESAYEWLPARTGEFASAFRPGSEGVVSFHLANMIRKYGEPYDPERYAARMIQRLRGWGFNSIGAFSGGGEKAWREANFPYVASLPINEWQGIPRLPQISETWDPFDEKVRTKIEENLAAFLPARADDPLLIGYFIINEPIYENIPHIVPTLKGEHACKRRFVQELARKYKTIAAFNAAWKMQGVSFDALNDLVLPVETDDARADVFEFTGLFLDELFRFVTETFRRHDKNHLLLGNRLQPGTINNQQLCRIAGKYVDVMSFNYYTNGIDQGLLRRIHEWTGGRPMMLSEFYWAASKESGLSGGREVATQRERGLAYRQYVEQSAALGFVVGIEWFTLIDQAFTGRWFQGLNGERANTGVLAVTDRPWKAMLEEVVKTNHDIYRVWLGEREPFAFDDPRFKPVP
jgi:hypothetical protein